jgi:hypothetical protein
MKNEELSLIIESFARKLLLRIEGFDKKLSLPIETFSSMEMADNLNQQNEVCKLCITM